MKNQLAKTLSGLGLRRFDAVLDRSSSLADSMRYGTLPDDLRMKATGYFERSALPAFFPHPKLSLLIGALSHHHAGTRRLHLQETVDLVAYGVNYFWEEQDTQPDHGPDGLLDDWTVIDRISIPLKRELDDYLLWSRRRFIEAEWLLKEARQARRLRRF